MASDLVYTVEEAAERLKIGRTLAWEMARDGRLPVLRLGRLVRVPAAALEQWVAGCGRDRCHPAAARAGKPRPGAKSGCRRRT